MFFVPALFKGQSFLLTVGSAGSAAGLDSSQTVTGLDFGAVATGRRIICAVHWIEGGFHYTLSSATIGGVSATVHVQKGHSGGSTGLGCAIISASVPTGTSGDVALTFAGSVFGAVVCPVRVTGLGNSSPSDTANAESVGTATDISTTINVPSNAFVMAVFTASTNADTKSVTWTGVTEQYDTNVSALIAEGRYSMGVSGQLSADASYDIVCDVSSNTADAGNSVVAVSWV